MMIHYYLAEFWLRENESLIEEEIGCRNFCPPRSHASLTDDLLLRANLLVLNIPIVTSSQRRRCCQNDRSDLIRILSMLVTEHDAWTQGSD